MRQLSTEWPKLLGAMMALETVAVMLSQLPEWWWRAVNHQSLRADEWVPLTIVVVLAALSVSLYRGAEWARRAAISCGVVSVVALIVNTITRGMQNIGRIPEFASTVTPELRAQQVVDEAGNAGWLLCLAVPVIVLACMLSHRDIAASFQRRSKEAI
jgi:hypothetical protein